MCVALFHISVRESVRARLLSFLSSFLHRCTFLSAHGGDFHDFRRQASTSCVFVDSSGRFEADFVALSIDLYLLRSFVCACLCGPLLPHRYLLKMYLDRPEAEDGEAAASGQPQPWETSTITTREVAEQGGSPAEEEGEKEKAPSDAHMYDFLQPAQVRLGRTNE